MPKSSMEFKNSPAGLTNSPEGFVKFIFGIQQIYIFDLPDEAISKGSTRPKGLRNGCPSGKTNHKPILEQSRCTKRRNMHRESLLGEVSPGGLYTGRPSGSKRGAKEEQKRGEREAKGKRKQKDFRFESITFAAAVLSAVPIDWATTPNDTERQPKVARARTVCRQQRRTAAERLPDGSPRSPERGRFDGNSARRQRLQRAGNNETPDDCKEQTTTKHPTIAKSRQQSTQRLQRANGNETPDGAKETPDGAKETPDDCKDQTSTKQQPLYNHTKR